MSTKIRTKGDDAKVFDVAKPSRPHTDPVIATRQIVGGKPRETNHNLLANEPDAAPGLSIHTKTINPPDASPDIIESKPASDLPPQASPVISKPPTMPNPNPTSPLPESPADPAEVLTEVTPAPTAPIEPASAATQWSNPEADKLIASRTYMVPLGTSKHRSPWLSVVLLLIIVSLGVAVALFLSQSLSI